MKSIFSTVGNPRSARSTFAALVMSAATATTLHAQAFKTFYSFEGAYGPVGLVQGTNGQLYGVTFAGGNHGGANYGGTVFKITTMGQFTSLYSFCAQQGCRDGANPVAGLIDATNGNFYGTTSNAGANGPLGSVYGTVFKITPSGALTTLYSFCSQTGCPDGQNAGGLIQSSGGLLYGTTWGGGAYGGGPYANGTVFRITEGGKLKTLYSFCAQIGCPDGSEPIGLLLQATDQNFYGSTNGGGAYGEGTVFKITAAGKLTSLYNFCATAGCPDGQNPESGLIQANNGNFYGVTPQGGASGNGTIFEITPAGQLTTLYSFCAKANCADGSFPGGYAGAGLVQATDGNFYGTTSGGGAFGDGTVFEFTPGGQLTTLWSVCALQGCADGSNPNMLVQDTNGIFYGTTATAGGGGGGTIFSLSVGPFVATRPVSGAVGSKITILGTNLAGSTSVTFNGTAATFRVVSGSEITTAVPTGATTGPVNVAAPGATLSSNVAFQVQ